MTRLLALLCLICTLWLPSTAAHGSPEAKAARHPSPIISPARAPAPPSTSLPTVQPTQTTTTAPSTTPPPAPTTTVPSPPVPPIASPVPAPVSPSPTPSSPSGNPSTGSPQTAAWASLAQCEEGGTNDPTFGYYGIYPSSWAAYGGTSFAPVAGQATLTQQTQIARKIETPPPWTDTPAGGCRGW